MKGDFYYGKVQRYTEIDEQLVYVEMVYHPGYYEKINHFQSTYVCPNNCIEESDGPQGETVVVKSNLPNRGE